MYSNLKYHLFSIIPGGGITDIIYLGMLIWIIAIFLSETKWGAFITVLITGLVFKGIDLTILNQGTVQVINEFGHFIALPLILTWLNGRISRLG
ncbi:MAG: hypothetical protein JW812_02415 [Alphaproteobacteria bacterium]|nr:hypothetical protein [Alphaproteobacteria bacterium]MBN2780275.1 hypothetical protein [Alphaproteobacteria bacterium]